MGSSKSGGRKLTSDQRDYIFHRMMTNGPKGRDRLAQNLAEEFHVTMMTIYKVYGSEEVLQRAKMKAEKKRLENLLRVQELAEKAIDVQEDLMTREVDDNMLYINQNAARDILDRAGVRAKDEQQVEQRIVFDTGNIDFGFDGKENTEKETETDE